MAHPGSYRWTDILPTFVSAGQGNTALTTQVAPDANSLSEYLHFRNNANARLSLRYQFPHGWKVGSEVRPHIHLMPCSAEAGGAEDLVGNAVLEFYWAWTQLGSGQVLVPWASWGYQKVVLPITVADQHKEVVAGPVPITPPSWAGLSAMLHVVMRRPASSDVDDTYEAANPVGIGSANLAVVSADAHALVAQTGSILEFSNG